MSDYKMIRVLPIYCDHRKIKIGGNVCSTKSASMQTMTSHHLADIRVPYRFGNNSSNTQGTSIATSLGELLRCA